MVLCWVKGWYSCIKMVLCWVNVSKSIVAEDQVGATLDKMVFLY